MYDIKFNGYSIYNPLDIGNGYGCIEAKLKTAVNSAGSLTLRLLPTHHNIDKLTRMHGIMSVQRDGSTIWRGRILRNTTDFHKLQTIECEGLLACLNDSVIEPYNFPGDYANDTGYQNALVNGNVIAYVLGLIITQHNAQVGIDQQLKLGNVTVTDPNNYITRSNSKHSTAWATLSEKLFKSSLGGYIIPRYEVDGTYIDYLQEMPTQANQTVEYAKNLLDIKAETNGADIYTAILPVGKDGLTISALPDGDITEDIVKSGKTLYSKYASAKYGKITKIVEWDDVTEATNLRRKAADTLGTESSSMPETITCQACDLNVIDGSIEAWNVGCSIKVVSAPHGYSDVYPLTELDIDLLDPAAATITLGRTKKCLTDAISEPKDGKDGADGKDGKTPHIGTNGDWYIGDTDTNVKAQGNDGKPGKDGLPGSNGKDGTNGKDGKDGTNGVSITRVYRYYKLTDGTEPAVPTTANTENGTPPSGWTNTEPSYTEGSAETLFTCVLTVFSNNTYQYSDVSKSSAYEAAKAAYGKVVAVEENVVGLGSTIETVDGKVSASASKITELTETFKSYTDDSDKEQESIRQRITMVENSVETMVTPEALTIEVNKVRQEVAEGAAKVKTSTGFTFDDEGLTINKSDSPTYTNIDDEGMVVKRKNGAVEEDVLTADVSGVNAINLTARQYLIIGNRSRFEDYGEDRTGCFWIGG